MIIIIYIGEQNRDQFSDLYRCPCLFVAASSSPVAVIASSILVQCHSISEHGQLSFMNQNQTHRLCSRVKTAIQLPLAAALLKQQQPAASSASLDEVKLIKLKVHLEAAVRLVREQVGVRSLSGLLLYQTQSKEYNLTSLHNVCQEGLVEVVKLPLANSCH